jgi:hypothetical protein
VSVGERVVDVFSLPLADDQARVEQYLQPLRDGGHRHPRLSAEFRDAVAPVEERLKETKTRHVAHRLEHGHTSGDHPIGSRLMVVWLVGVISADFIKVVVQIDHLFL